MRVRCAVRPEEYDDAVKGSAQEPMPAVTPYIQETHFLLFSLLPEMLTSRKYREYRCTRVVDDWKPLQGDAPTTPPISKEYQTTSTELRLTRHNLQSRRQSCTFLQFHSAPEFAESSGVTGENHEGAATSGTESTDRTQRRGVGVSH